MVIYQLFEEVNEHRQRRLELGAYVEMHLRKIRPDYIPQSPYLLFVSLELVCSVEDDLDVLLTCFGE